MNTVSKPNDWFLARAENPDFNYDDFAEQGITVDNTALRSKEVYQNSNYVREMFSDEEGNFNQSAFDKAYTEISKSYQIYANKQYEEGALEDMEFDPYNPFRPIDSEVYTPEAKLVREVNPLGKAEGFTGIGSFGPAVRSASESAQMSKIFDWEAQQFRDYSPNDVALENSVVGFVKQAFEPLVMAQYESEGYHTDPFSGEQVHHMAGEYKVNDQGQYYYETLGGRSAYGKQFKSIMDSLTVDGSKANDFDFFDSDGLDKSVVGTLMKTAVTIAPLFTPIAPYYGWAMIGTELLDLLPTVYESTVGNFSEDTNPTLNYIQGLGKSLKSSTTEYAKENILAMENLGKIISDVALQWQQFRIIPQAYNKLVGTDKVQEAVLKEAKSMAATSAPKRIMEAQVKQGITDEKALGALSTKIYQQEYSNALGVLNKTKLEPLLKANNRTGANVALGYMAALQSVQTYEDAINLGVSKTEAAALGWGTALGVYAVGRTGLGELFFPQLQDVNKKAYTIAINKMKDSIQSGIGNLASMPKKTRLLKLMDVGKRASSKFWQDVRDHSLGFVGKAIGEGIEEMTEEGVSDFFKATHNLAADFGVASTDKKFSFDGMGERYLMSFVGGSMGGAVFGAVDLVNHIKSPESVKQELTYLLRNGRKEELLQELDTLHKKGKLGSTVLSTEYSEDPSDPNVRYFKTAESSDKSHNTFIYNKMKNYIEAIDTAINQEKMNYSDSDILDKLARSDERLAQVQEVIGKDGINGRYLQRFNTLTSEIITQKAKIQELENATPDSKKQGSEKESFQKTLQEEYAKLDELKTELNDYFSDANVVDYANKLLFEIDSNVNQHFYNANMQQYIEGRSGKKVDELSEQQLEKYKQDYEAFKKLSIRDKFEDAYAIFKNLNHKLTADVNERNELYTQYGKMRQFVLNEIIDPVKTSEKFGEHESIESILEYVLNGTVDLLEVANDDYIPRKRIAPEGAAPEVLQKIEEHNQQVVEKQKNVVNKIKETIGKLKEIGFIDSDTKKLLLSIAPRLDLQGLISGKYLISTTKDTTTQVSVLEEVEKILDQKQFKLNLGSQTLTYDTDEETGEFKGYAFNQDTKDQAIKEIQEILTNVATFKDFDANYDEVILQISQVLSRHLNDSESRVDLMNWEHNPNRAQIMNFGEDGSINIDLDQDYDVTYTWFGMRVRELVGAVKKVVESTPQYNFYQEIKSELESTQNNPLYDFLQKLSVSINGAHSSIIDLLQKKEFDLENGDIEDFNIDSVVVDEIDSALNLIDIANSLVNAADTQELNAFNIYGHNAIINDFSRKMGLPTEYGLISQDNAYVIRGDLKGIADKLKLIKQISLLNEANSFKEQERTGKNTTKLLTQILKCTGKYTALKDVEVQGVKLFEGIQNIDTEQTDKNTKDLSDDVYVEHAHVTMALYNNYQKILQQAYANGLTEKEAAIELISQLRSVFSSKNLQDQETSELNSAINEMTDSDIMTYIITSCSIDPITWNQSLKALISSEATKFVPLYPQELDAMIGTALIKEGTLFREYITSIAENYKGKGVPNALHNWVICNGVGGAGKTSVVGKIIYSISKQIDPEIKTWNIGPTDTQVSNLNKTLPPDDSMEIDLFMKKILDPSEYEKLSKAMSDKNKDSRYSKPTSDGIGVKMPDDLKFSDVEAPSVVFIDECTYVNSIYAKIISEWAQSKGVTIVGLGDAKQSGFYDEKMALFKVSRASAISVRTPELNISMRASNIQKKANNNKLSSILTVSNNIAFGNDDLQPVYKNLLSNFSLRYFINDDGQVMGDHVTDTITKERLESIIKGCKSFIYIYDDVNSPTYKIVQDLKTQNPEVNIELFTLDQVQGREADQVVVDLDFSKYDSNQASDMRAVNTALTRALEGTTIINKGFTTLFKGFKNTKDSYTAKTPDPEKIIENYKNSKIKIIDRILSEVAPPEVATLPEPSTPTPGPAPTPTPTPSPSPSPEPGPEPGSEKSVKGKKRKPKLPKKPEPSPNEESGEQSEEEKEFVSKLSNVISSLLDNADLADESILGSQGLLPDSYKSALKSALIEQLNNNTGSIPPDDIQSILDELDSGALNTWEELYDILDGIYSIEVADMEEEDRMELINSIENDSNLSDDAKQYATLSQEAKQIILEALRTKKINTWAEFYDAIDAQELQNNEEQEAISSTISVVKEELAANDSTIQEKDKSKIKEIIQKHDKGGYQSLGELESDLRDVSHFQDDLASPTILTDEDVEILSEISDSLDEEGNDPPSLEPQYVFGGGIRTLGSYKETGVEINNDIVTFQETQGIKDDLQIWLDNGTNISEDEGSTDYDFAYRSHKVLRSQLIHYPDDPSIALNCLEKETGSKTDLFKESFMKGTYKVIAYTPKNDTSKKIVKLVYSYVINGTECRITLSQLSNPDVWLNYLTNTLGLKNANSDEVKAAQKYKIDYENILSKVTKQNPIYEFELAPGNVQSAQFNIISPEHRYAISQVEEYNPDIIHGEALLYSGVDGELTSCYSGPKAKILKEKAKKLQGKAVMFMTTCEYLQDYDGQYGEPGEWVKVDSTNIKQLYLQQRRRGQHHIIRRMIVDPATNYATNRWEKDGITKVKGYLNMDFDAMAEESEDGKADVRLQGSELVGVRMFVGLWNYRARLLNFKKVVDRDEFKNDDGEIIVSRVNEFIKNSGENTIKAFRLSSVESEYRTHPDSTNEKYISHFDCSPITNKDSTSPYKAGLHMTYKELYTQYEYINAIVEFIYDKVLKTGKSSLTLKTIKNQLKPDTLIEYNSRVYKKLYTSLQDNITISGTDVKINDSNMSIEETTTGVKTPFRQIDVGKSQSIAIILSRLYKIIGLQTSRDVVDYFNLGNFKIGNEEINLSEEPLIKPLYTNKGAYKGVYRASLFLDIINTALHGRPRPYTQNVHAIPSPFPRGIFYNLMYKKTPTHDTTLAEFHEIANPDKHMQLNARVTAPHLYINLDGSVSTSTQPTTTTTTTTTIDQTVQSAVQDEIDRLSAFGIDTSIFSTIDVNDSLENVLGIMKEAIEEWEESNIEAKDPNNIGILSFDSDKRLQSRTPLIEFIQEGLTGKIAYIDISDDGNDVYTYDAKDGIHKVDQWDIYNDRVECAGSDSNVTELSEGFTQAVKNAFINLPPIEFNGTDYTPDYIKTLKAIFSDPQNQIKQIQRYDLIDKLGDATMNMRDDIESGGIDASSFINYGQAELVFSVLKWLNENC